MNYNDQILENKTFNFFKQLMYNIALAICIMLVGVLILVYGFNYKLYDVESNSQAPYYFEGDMVIVKAQDEYKVGDIIKFDESSTKTFPTTHRLIAILKDSKGETRYICHGDNVQNLDRSEANGKWEDDAEFIRVLAEDKKQTFEQILNEHNQLIQAPTLSQVEGKVVNHIDNYGNYLEFIKEHPMLLIALVAGIWCVSSTIQVEMDIKKARRLI